jgi:hypothetical protein
MNVVPVTIGARAPTNDTLAPVAWRDPARPDACKAPSMMCQRPWMRPVPRLPPKMLSGNSPSSSIRSSWMKSSAVARSSVRLRSDSLAEEAGFEPSVPPRGRRRGVRYSAPSSAYL